MKEPKDFLPLIIIGFVFLVIFRELVLIPIILFAVYYFYTEKQKRMDTTIIRPSNTNFMNNIDINQLKFKASHGLGGVVIIILIVIFLFNAVRVVPAGETGVYHLFGKVRDTEVHSGIHIINPLASLKMMSIRTEQYTMSIVSREGQKSGDDSIEALTKEGLKVGLDMTVLYHLNEDQASDVYRDIGLNYVDKIIRPEVRSAIREVIALYEAKDIYSEKRDEAVVEIEELLAVSLGPRGIEVESVLLRNVALPPLLRGAIEEKLTAEQEAQKYDFILQKEEKEAERKRIEARGQRDAQSIINQSLTTRYIQYLYIQNLEEREGTIYVPYDLPLLRGI